jgi:hypothetical protein
VALVIIGSKEPAGTYDLAPKPMAISLGWQNYYGFVCSPRDASYRNIRRECQFTVSFPRPTDVVTSSLAASPCCDNDAKPALALLEQRKATTVDSVRVDSAMSEVPSGRTDRHDCAGDARSCDVLMAPYTTQRQ